MVAVQSEAVVCNACRQMKQQGMIKIRTEQTVEIDRWASPNGVCGPFTTTCLYHQTAACVTPPPPPQPWVESTTNATGDALGADADVPWLKVTPNALRGVLTWLTQRYGPVEIKVRHHHHPHHTHMNRDSTETQGEAAWG